MRVSVAIATFNGARYLDAQLRSIEHQTLKPDEIVISDDSSCDNTLKIITDFQQTTEIDVRISSNPHRLGFVKNFERAISLCSGDLIFLSDQDDVWYPNKISTIASIFVEHPKTHVCIHDQDIVDSDLAPTGQTTFQNCFQLGVSSKWIVTGCCTAFTRNFRDLALPFPDEITSHDGWIHRLADLLNNKTILPLSLQLYRRHDTNASKSLASKKTLFPRLKLFVEQSAKKSPLAWRREVAISRAALLVITERAREILHEDPNKLESIREIELSRIELLEGRINISSLSRSKRIFAICRSKSKHNSLYKWASMVKDLVL